MFKDLPSVLICTFIFKETKLVISGDIAILHHAGLSMKRALLYNFGAALLILVGLVLGILLGENTEANAWIFASAGGMFIYISLVDIVSVQYAYSYHFYETRFLH